MLAGVGSGIAVNREREFEEIDLCDTLEIELGAVVDEEEAVASGLLQNWR